MNSTLHNYFSPVKILLLLFTLLLTFEVAINYFSSSSISIIRFRKNNNNTLKVDKSKNDNQYPKPEVQSSNQLDYYGDSRNEWIYTKDSSNKSVLSYIRKNCNSCVNTQLVNDHHHHFKCPKQ